MLLKEPAAGRGACECDSREGGNKSGMAYDDFFVYHALAVSCLTDRDERILVKIPAKYSA